MHDAAKQMNALGIGVPFELDQLLKVVGVKNVKLVSINAHLHE
jgi:hypothetical protein